MLCAILLCACGTGAANRPDLQPQVDEFVDEMVREHGFDRGALSALLGRAEFQQSIIDAMRRPAEAKPWYQYRPIFVTESRIRDGVSFWNANEAILQQVSTDYGVPPEILVAIVGVETRYGGYTGRHRVLDSLHTLAFGYPKRAAFFRGELEDFLLLTREEGIDPAEAKGSYAGAMGKPQFISSSYRAYAVDYDGDGRRDLWDSNADVIASVANYFKRHGWRQGEPVTVRAHGVDDSDRAFVEAGMKPSLRVRDLRDAGIETDPSIDGDALASLIELDTGTGKEYWLGLHNFYVITRYNHSNLYSMAVYQLSQEIRALREAREIDPLVAR
ncbi:MAG: lytic murein transglycosylase B [Chromatiales bacterium]|jgi:membrane-bound lytic murein transglycosylase B